jgi:hypothetical protein
MAGRYPKTLARRPSTGYMRQRIATRTRTRTMKMTRKMTRSWKFREGRSATRLC